MCINGYFKYIMNRYTFVICWKDNACHEECNMKINDLSNAKHISEEQALHKTKGHHPEAYIEELIAGGLVWQLKMSLTVCLLYILYIKLEAGGLIGRLGQGGLIGRLLGRRLGSCKIIKKIYGW